MTRCERTLSAGRQRRILLLLLSGVGANAAMLAVSALNTFVVARNFGPSGRGAVALAMICANYLSILAGGSLESGILHFRNSDLAPRDALARVAWRYQTRVCVPTVAVGVAALRLIGLPWPTAIVFAMGCAAMTPLSAASALARIAGRTTLSVWIPIVPVLLQQLFGIGAVVTGRDLDATLVVMAVGTLVGAIPSLLVFRTRQGSAAAKGCSQAPGLLNYSLRAHPGALVHAISTRLPSLVLAPFGGRAAVGIFSVGQSLGEVGLLSSQGVLAASLPHTSSHRARLTVRRAVMVSLAAGLPTAAWVALCGTVGRYFVRAAVGRAFDSTVPVLWALAPGLVALSAWRTVAYVGAAMGHGQARTVSAFVGCVVMASLLCVLCPLNGIVGAGIAASAGWAVMLVTWFVLISFARRAV